MHPRYECWGISKRCELDSIERFLQQEEVLPEAMDLTTCNSEEDSIEAAVQTCTLIRVFGGPF